MRIYKQSGGIGVPGESFYLISAGGVMYSIEETQFHSNGNGNSTIERYNIPDLGYEDQHKEINYQIQDHLGNLRLSYTVLHCPSCSEQNCASVDVQYQINYIAEYLAYGGLLREFVRNGTAGEKFLSTGHERDKQTSWDYRQARYYDADLGRFLAVDPMAGAAPGWSPYRYAFDNPIRYVDLDGNLETDFGIAKNGAIVQIGPTDNKPDRLFVLNNETGAIMDRPNINLVIKPIIIKDKKVLPDLTKWDSKNFTTQTYWGELVGSWTKRDSKDDALKLFKFASDYSDVEWALQQFKRSRFLIGTSHFSESVGNLHNAARYNVLDLKLDYHSHPGTSPSDDVASGWYGDQGRASSIIHKFLEANIDYPYHPIFKIYRPDNIPKTSFEYSPWTNKFNTTIIRSYLKL